MKINAKYRLNAAVSIESKVLVEMAKAAYKHAKRDLLNAADEFSFAFNFFYKKKYNEQELAVIYTDAFCNILKLNDTLAKNFNDDITKFTEQQYFELIYDVVYYKHNYAAESIMLSVIEKPDALLRALYESFKKYIMSKRYNIIK